MGEGVIKYMVILYGFLGWFDIEQIIAPAGGHFASLYEARMVQSQIVNSGGFPRHKPMKRFLEF